MKTSARNLAPLLLVAFAALDPARAAEETASLWFTSNIRVPISERFSWNLIVQPSVLGGVTVFLVGGQYLGIPIATLLTSAGIGERIVFREYDGIVEDIGLRSTKLRLLDGKLVTLPNDLLASNEVANVARRPYIRRVGEIHIPLDTPCEKVERAVAILRDELHEHEGMDADRPPRVFFREFAPGAFSIQFSYWYAPPKRWKFLEFNEKLNFNVFRRFEAEGIQFSLPFRHSFWKHDDEQGPMDVNLVGNDSLRARESSGATE